MATIYNNFPSSVQKTEDSLKEYREGESAMFPSLTSRSFGRLPTGALVEAWTLTGRGGLSLEIITLGATVTRLLVPDRNGSLADVVLGFNDPAPYLTSRGYFGATVGRVAGRITGARFTLGDKIYELAPNDAPNHLHGGREGFDKKIWAAAPVDRSDKCPSLRLELTSRDGEEGYPGTVNVAVTYTVADDNVVRIESDAATDHPTPFNLTNHSYFNLAGEGALSIADHELEIFADYFVPVDEYYTNLGRLEPVDARVDFRTTRTLEDSIPEMFKQHGALYRLQTGENDGSNLKRAARLAHSSSGRVLSVSTTEPYMQLYTGSGLDGSLRGKSGQAYQRCAGICLECQGYPDSANVPELGSILLPSQPHRALTAYAFTITAIGETEK